MKAKILIVDDELVICRSCEKIFTRAGHEVVYTTSGKEAIQILSMQPEDKPFDVVFTDLKMMDIGGMEVLQTVRQKYPDTLVVVITGYATIASAVETMRYGAFDYLPKPFTPAEILGVLEKALEKRKIIQITQHKYNYITDTGFEGMIGRSSRMCEVYSLIQKVAPTDSTVLIVGESGTGKDLTAKAIHKQSNRKNEKYFAVDISTLTPTLLESELFGHVKGSFTGAYTTKQGIFEVANNGTIFLDEIGNLSVETQARLLRVLQEKQIIPVGSTSVKNVDVRLIFATNKNLKNLVAEGKFREDLYYRLNVFPIKLPSLRERREDIPELVMFFFKKHCEKVGREIPFVQVESMDILMNYNWPGNVRELEHTIERLVIVAEEDQIKPVHISTALYHSESAIQIGVPKDIYELNTIKKQLRESSIFEIEKSFVLEALIRNDWNISRAARDVSMQRPNFQALMKKYGINKDG